MFLKKLGFNNVSYGSELKERNSDLVNKLKGVLHYLLRPVDLSYVCNESSFTSYYIVFANVFQMPAEDLINCLSFRCRTWNKVLIKYSNISFCFSLFSFFFVFVFVFVLFCLGFFLFLSFFLLIESQNHLEKKS